MNDPTLNHGAGAGMSTAPVFDDTVFLATQENDDEYYATAEDVDQLNISYGGYGSDEDIAYMVHATEGDKGGKGEESDEEGEVSFDYDDDASAGSFDDMERQDGATYAQMDQIAEYNVEEVASNVDKRGKHASMVSIMLNDYSGKLYKRDDVMTEYNRLLDTHNLSITNAYVLVPLLIFVLSFKQSDKSKLLTKANLDKFFKDLKGDTVKEYQFTKYDFIRYFRQFYGKK